MKTICITDIHGYLETALEALRALEEETGMELLDGDEWISEHELVVNGDVFDRGPENREALEWVIENADVYNLGNHEFFALFPDTAEQFMSQEYIDRTGKDGQYWRHMDDMMMEKLLEMAVSGELTVGHRRHEYIYLHAGAERPDFEALNDNFRQVGERLLEAFEEGKEAYRQRQQDIAWVESGRNGRIIESRHPELFQVGRDVLGGLDSDAVIWKRMDDLETEVRQVIGHSTGFYMKDKGFGLNPQRKGGALNINTIRDNVSEGKPVAVTVEDRDGLEVHSLEI